MPIIYKRDDHDVMENIIEEEICTQMGGHGDNGNFKDRICASEETGHLQHQKSEVAYIKPADIPDLEFCLVSTDAILDLLIKLHGPVCKWTGCNCQLEFDSSFVGTCLVVHWFCKSGHFGGRWAAQPTCEEIPSQKLGFCAR